uniref:Small primase-like Toprim domain-containing protein n=1 Tax=uncultured marine group II/III euryarchaeote KM3_178_D06 TaxID=1457940 RepID=A0A075GM94_9EURY|nr:Small primase-like Toprim domain-containing protein [uncultured marine group II/III euryarchaeote KM3_178_D06]
MAAGDESGKNRPHGVEWEKTRAKSAGPPDREVRFEIAGRALGEARRRNREGGSVVESSEIVGDEGAGCPILVEGKRDVIALRKLGFTGKIEKVNRGWNMPRLVAYLYEKYGTRNPIDGREAIILLMDWDRTGGRIQRDLTNRLESLDVKVDCSTRKEIARCLKPEGRTVEGLAAHASELKVFIDEHDFDGAGEEE